jgi:hypothetical protein
MARRRRQGGENSLELLLDTICNVFGGIVFIAILVALLTSSTNVEPTPSEAKRPSVTAADVREARDLRAEISSYRSGIEHLQSLAETISSGEQRSASQKLEQLEKARAKAEERAGRLETWLQRYQASKTEVKESLTEQLRTAQRRLKKRRHQRDQLLRQKKGEARLPAEQRTQKTQVIFLIENGELHWAPIGGGRDALPAAYKGQVNLDRQLRRVSVQPKPGEGINIGDLKNQQEVQRIFHTLDPRTHFLDLSVASDSVESFKKLRAAATSRGFEYDVGTYPAGKAMTFGVTDGPLTTQ